MESGTPAIMGECTEYELKISILPLCFFIYLFKDISIQSISGVQIKVLGLGPLNWVVRMMVVRRIKKLTRKLILKKTREEMEKVISQQSIIDQLYIHVLHRRVSRK